MGTESPNVQNEIEFVPASMELRFRDGRLEHRSDDLWTDITLVRLFPFSDSRAWMSVLDSDQKEIGILRELDALEPASIEAVEQYLQNRYLVPQIVDIESCTISGEETVWAVKTNRGDVTFKTGATKDNLEQLPSDRILIKDKDGNRYEIPDLNKLKPESRRFIDRQL